MKNIITVLKALSNGDMQLFNEVAYEIRDLLVTEESPGVCILNTREALRFAFLLELSAEDEKLPAKEQTHHELLKEGASPELINRIFAQKPASSQSGKAL